MMVSRPRPKAKTREDGDTFKKKSVFERLRRKSVSNYAPLLEEAEAITTKDEDLTDANLMSAASPYAAPDFSPEDATIKAKVVASARALPPSSVVSLFTRPRPAVHTAVGTTFADDEDEEDIPYAQQVDETDEERAERWAAEREVREAEAREDLRKAEEQKALALAQERDRREIQEREAREDLRKAEALAQEQDRREMQEREERMREEREFEDLEREERERLAMARVEAAETEPASELGIAHPASAPPVFATAVTTPLPLEAEFDDEPLSEQFSYPTPPYTEKSVEPIPLRYTPVHNPIVMEATSHPPVLGKLERERLQVEEMRRKRAEERLKAWEMVSPAPSYQEHRADVKTRSSAAVEQPLRVVAAIRVSDLVQLPAPVPTATPALSTPANVAIPMAKPVLATALPTVIPTATILSTPASRSKFAALHSIPDAPAYAVPISHPAPAATVTATTVATPEMSVAQKRAQQEAYARFQSIHAEKKRKQEKAMREQGQAMEMQRVVAQTEQDEKMARELQERERAALRRPALQTTTATAAPVTALFVQAAPLPTAVRVESVMAQPVPVSTVLHQASGPVVAAYPVSAPHAPAIQVARPQTYVRSYAVPPRAVSRPRVRCPAFRPSLQHKYDPRGAVRGTVRASGISGRGYTVSSVASQPRYMPRGRRRVRAAQVYPSQVMAQPMVGPGEVMARPVSPRSLRGIPGYASHFAADGSNPLPAPAMYSPPRQQRQDCAIL